jgi:glyoxylase-like metal-dependent hydrolase (beta-lactamase superfamily II)
MLHTLRSEGLRLDSVFLTHTHEDHIADLDRLVAATGAPVYVSEREPHSAAKPFPDGANFKLGGLAIGTLPTWGHSPGGTSYVVTGLAHPLAVVGDALFASSMGGSRDTYAEQYRHNVEKILTLPEDTVLACGHGPLTTVGQEKAHNPFFTR